MNRQFENQIIQILKGIGIVTSGDCIEDSHVSNETTSKSFNVEGTGIRISVCEFGNGNCRIDIDFRLPEGSVLADTFMDFCAGKEGTKKNNYGEYFFGPSYATQMEENRNKQTFAISPWSNTFFYVRSEHYKVTELDEAVENAIGLAKQFVSHLPELKTLRYWNTEDKEVIDKAKDIIENAALQETDCDREEKAHYLVDSHSFIKGWFYPFRDAGKGTFDTVWPSSVEYAASCVSRKGTFEYAIACIVLTNESYIAKARKACRIRKETKTYMF